MVGILKDLIESFSSRIKNKILFNFALSWVVLNRSDILMLLFIDGINKKEILSKLFATKHFIDDLLWLSFRNFHLHDTDKKQELMLNS